MLRRLAKATLFRLVGLLALLKPLLKTESKHIYVIGDLYSESGLGNVTRAFIQTLEGIVDYSVINLPMSVMSKQGAYQFGSRETRRLGPGINIFIGNPSILLLGFRSLNLLAMLRNYTIGIWFWELERIPRDWAIAGKLVDEVWAQSAFVARAFEGSSRRVEIMPFVLDHTEEVRYDRRHFGLPEQCFVFLMTFDYLSHVARKNPIAVLNAFRSEFGDDPSVLLVIKSVNRNRRTHFAEDVESIINASSNVISMDRYLDKDELLSLIRVTDCYVSLHRSEGLGLGMAEAMSLGTLVVATGYSGNMDYMSADNALLVDYQLKPVNAAEYPYASNNVWAEPSIDSARYQMRVAKQSGSKAQNLTENARRSIARYDTAAQQRWVLSRLGQLG